MTALSKAADLAQRAATLALFGTLVACGAGIVNQVREYKESVKETPSNTSSNSSTTNVVATGDSK
eukprot:CAMPEP_0172423604 /NCGR_PEP_ID=MMETSP1064-20121228/17600_1 /TAXON_ID=202472 /ORGANISM="Aulacoseira subarctica , Strain CCAP 1002/5" /LENGTH=64 /DNA_ID=CAMNT_0013165051 /DNA_START=18 /DNA_END=212 /DNA_ORIENTATION=-